MRKNSLLIFLVKILLSLTGCIIGSILAGVLYHFLPFWTITPFGQAAADSRDILFVNYLYPEATSLEKNILYIQNQSGEVYSLAENSMQTLPSLPDGKTILQIQIMTWSFDAPIVAKTAHGETFQLLKGQWEVIPDQKLDFKGFSVEPCAAEWLLPAIGVQDSAGTVFRHALANEYVCYLLFDDGRLQIWTRTLDAFSLMGYLVIGAFAGLLAGFNLMAIIKRLRRLWASRKAPIT